jgi:hypothetical protein
MFAGEGGGARGARNRVGGYGRGEEGEACERGVMCRRGGGYVFVDMEGVRLE